MFPPMTGKWSGIASPPSPTKTRYEPQSHVEQVLLRSRRIRGQTSASWLNMVERFFRALTENQLRRGVFKNLEQLIMTVGNYIDQLNQNPKPFVWTAKASDILEKVIRAQAS